MKPYKDQVAVITGAASGLGMAIAAKLAHQGLKLALMDINAGKLQNLAGQLSSQAKAYPVDITDEKQVKQVLEQVASHFGTIDILVNSAGITGETNIKSHETDTEDVRKVFEVNYYGAYFSAKYALPYMLKQNYGRVLHIASIAGKEGNAGMLAYSSAKAAVIAMAKVQGKEYAETGITINALAPAVIRTPMVAAMPEAQVKYMTDKIPVKRCGTLEEVANLVNYIVSPQNSFTTGFTFDLSGGRATY
jgi:NAD(P)-dependent dehydrogenase (short-subunit alcohol dehydrogenase family)